MGQPVIAVYISEVIYGLFTLTAGIRSAVGTYKEENFFVYNGYPYGCLLGRFVEARNSLQRPWS
jgi:hypothetical protein